MTDPSSEGASIGVCSWSLRPDSVERLLQSLESIPANAIQLALVPLIEHPRQWSDAIAIVRDRGVRVLSGMMSTIGEDYSTLESIKRSGGFRPDEHWSRNLDRALRLADLAADNGIAFVTVHAGFIPDDASEPLHAQMLDRIRIIAATFARRGIGLALETGQERAEALIDFLHALEAPSVGVNFDPANMILYGMGEPVDALVKLLPWVRQIHIKDAVPTTTPGTWGKEVPVGTGAVDWQRVGEVIRRVAPPVDLVIEREAGGERIPDVRAAMTVARSMCGA